MKEMDMQTFFGKAIQKTPPKETEIYELKICKNNSFPFDKIKPHQIEALLKAESSSFYHKITDPPVFYGMNSRFNIKRPFDCLCLVNVKAYLVFWFYKPNQPKKFIKVRINDFLEFKSKSKMKSFKEAEILGVASEVVNILKI